MKRHLGKMLLSVGVVWLACGCEPETETNASPVDLRPRVKVCSLTEGVEFEEAIIVQGSVRSKFTAAVASRLPGTIDALYADEGETVAAGQRLFQVDRVNLENRVAIAKDDCAVAAAARDEALAVREEAMAAHEKAVIDEARYARLYTVSGSVTKDVWEKAQLQLKSTTASVARANAAVATAEAKILQAATALRIAEKDLADSQGVAPFAGVLTKKLQEAGDYAEVGGAIFEIENPEVREVCFMVNADNYARVKVGETRLETSFGQTLVVSYRAPTVNPVSRTFEVRAVIQADETVAPGMLCEAKIIFERRRGSAVPSGAVALREGRQVVFVVTEAGRVEAVPVEKGRTCGALTEVRNPEPLAGAAIVAEGMLLLNPGDEVKAIR